MQEKLSQILAQASGISDDSRNVSSNDIFFAISGTNTDGTKYIQDAISKGAKYIISEKTLDEIGITIPQDITHIQVPDARKNLAESLKIFYDDPSRKIKMIGITGTNGKTTISNLIYSILSSLGKKTLLIGTNGIYVGDQKHSASLTTPGILELNKLLDTAIKRDCQYCVMEVSSHALDQKRVEGITFDVAVFSNLSQDHLDYHHTMENYASAKKILFTNLNKEATAITNLDDEYGAFMLDDTKAKKIGITNKSRAQKSFDGQSIKFESEANLLKINNNKYHSNLIGEYNSYNLTQAILSVLELGLKLEEVIDASKNLYAPEGRMQLVKLNNSALAVIDYAHTPDALEKALQALKAECKGKLICVFGCGGDRDKTKRPIMGAVALAGSDLPICTSDNPRTEDPNSIISDIVAGNEDKYIIEPDRKSAILRACEIAGKNDVILIAGKGHEKYQIIGTTKINFDDVEIVNEFNKKYINN